MSRVITFSRMFPGYHPRKGEPTNFVQKIWKGLKKNNQRDKEYNIYIKYPRLMKAGHWQIPIEWRDQMRDKEFLSKYHTIRAGHRWKVGDWFSPRAWSDKPYNSKQIIIAPDIQIKKIWDFDIELLVGDYLLNGYHIPIDTLRTIANNDGFQQLDDFKCWFPGKSGFIGQMICWNENISY